MPPRTNAFQRIVTLLHATLAGQASVVESAMLTDKVTGEQREVDVLITASAANYTVALGVEAVDWSRPAGTPWIEKMRAKHENLSVDKLILVSRRGFTKPALAKAHFYGIETLTVETACAIDWPVPTQLGSKGIFEVITVNYQCTFVCVLEGGYRELIDAPLIASVRVGASNVTVNALVLTLLRRQDVRDALYPRIAGSDTQDFWATYTQPEGLGVIEHNGRTGKIGELRVSLKVLRTETPVQFAAGTFRRVSFIAGVSASEARPLQFVLARKADGTVDGFLVDDGGVQALSVP
jgi:hypothetical protein